MAKKKYIPESMREDIVSDWKTGKYTQQAVADKYGVSVASANKIVKGVEKSLETLIVKQMAINQELTSLPEKDVNKFREEVNERTRDMVFFRKPD